MLVNKIFLAPMEGVIDGCMRNLLTQINNYDMCITEFVRVVDRPVPKNTFYKIAPELLTGGTTINGTPIRVQLLGQNASWMAENAYIATSLGSNGIDINFGCPAPTVNKSKGGATLLKSPETMYEIITAVKKAVNSNSHEVSVKIRLGFDDTSLFKEIASAVTEAAPAQVTVHARTKKQGYKPPAYWHYIKKMNALDGFDVIANGEIWSLENAQSCMLQSNTSSLMLGRGALAMPNLANVIKYNDIPYSWQQVCALLVDYANLEPEKTHPYYYSSRVKQWLKYLKLHYSEGKLLFDDIKKETDKSKILKIIEAQVNG